MRRSIALIMLGCLLSLMGLTAVYPADEDAAGPVVRVGVLRGVAAVTIRGSGECRVVDLDDGDLLAVIEDGEAVEFHLAGGEVEFGAGLSAPAILIEPPAGEGDAVPCIQVNNLRYRGQVEIVAIAAGLTVINTLPVEEYIYGVVPREMPAAWPAEALKAQAIAARTIVLRASKHRAEGFDVCASVCCQVYGGLGGEDPRSNAAVAATAGQVLTYDGKLITAVYHSSSGGYTEDNENVWKGDPTPYLRGIPDEFDSSQPDNPHASWFTRLTRAELQEKLAAAGTGVGEVYTVAPAGTATESGRQRGVIVRGSSGTQEIPATTFRTYLGLKSTKFTLADRDEHEAAVVLSYDSGEQLAVQGAYGTKIISPREITVLGAGGVTTNPAAVGVLGVQNIPAGVELAGQGYGHGVGMAQWGARGMADAGYNCEQILQHYYQGVTIETR